MRGNARSNTTRKPSGNCAVHYPLLALALALEPYSTALRALNCTSATINSEYQAPQPRSTSPSTHHHPSVAQINAAAPSQEEAELQMCVWMAAHFARLHALVVRQHERRPGPSTPAKDVFAAETQWRRAVEELSFLRGLPVLQHQWFFIAAMSAPPPEGSTNYWGRGIILWRMIGIGSTSKPEGVCHIIYAVRHLALWVRSTY
ncbi:hypothetical protein B0H67DRAFT_646004 [Lasiosphaeris hirsuta]|uniref:PD-(D/E)XK nuclease-like domain-containing protein n=1 Tax=Lasiosphaeris hirsuta TaxID=260670 RepID=A0AA40AIE2_9PEZI|nr:hypothetical protein B0H67DRAFT_646004 [Lasiosphaeris hirsuta]